MGRSLPGRRRASSGRPSRSASERRRELSDVDDLVDADHAIRGITRRPGPPEPDEFDPRHHPDTGTADIAP